MVYGFMLVVHVVVSLLLIGIILVQGGRGGMAETLGGSAAQSLFGGGANLVMSKITAIGAGLFMVTCLTLAVLSTHRGRSVIEQVPLTVPESLPISPTGRPPTTPPSSPTSATNPTPSAPSSTAPSIPEPTNPSAPAQ